MMEVVFVLLSTMLSPKQLVQCEFGERDILVEGVQIIGIDSRNEVANQPQALGVGEGRPLVLHHLIPLIVVVIHFSSEQCYLFNLKTGLAGQEGEREGGRRGGDDYGREQIMQDSSE
jgi:hypothetical protein